MKALLFALPFYNFVVISASDLLLEGKIMDQRLQPHFSHLPYILQFFIDYNLHGMNFIMVSKVTHRTETGERNLFDPMTCCRWECDCVADDILNVNEEAICGGLGLIWEEEKERRRRLGKSSQPPPDAEIQRNEIPLQPRESRFLQELQKITEKASDGQVVASADDENIFDFAQIVAELLEKNHEINNHRQTGLSRTDFFESDNEFSDDDEDIQEMSLKLSEVLSQPMNVSDEQGKEPQTSTCKTSGRATQVIRVIEQECEDIAENASQQSFDEFDDDDEDFMEILSQLSKNQNDGYSQQTVEDFDDDFDDEDVRCACKNNSICCDLCCDHRSKGCRRMIPQIDGNSDEPGCSNGSGRRKRKFKYTIPSERKRKVLDTSSSSKKRAARKVQGMTLSLSPSITDQELKRLCSVKVVIEDEPRPRPSTSGKSIKRKSSRKLSFCEADDPILRPEDLEKFVSKCSSDANDSTPTDVYVPLSQNTIIISDTDESKTPSPDKFNEEEQVEEVKLVDSEEEETSAIFGQEDSEIFSLYDYASSQGSIRSLDSPAAEKSLSEVSSTQTIEFCSQNSNAPIHSTPNRPRRSRNKSRLSEIAMGDMSIISPASQPLATIREESSLSPQKSSRQKPYKIFTAEEYLNCNPPPVTQENDMRRSRRRNVSCDSLIGGAARSQSISFAVSSFGESAAETRRGVSDHEFQRITTFSLELHVETRGSLRPDPDHDSIKAVFYSYMVDEPSNDDEPRVKTGIIIVDFNDEFLDFNCSQIIKNSRSIVASSGFLRSDVKITEASDEVHLMMLLIDIMRELDPEIILGFEIEMASWSYLVDRSQKLNVNISSALSRLLESDIKPAQNQFEAKKDNFDLDHSFRANPIFHLKVPGRIVLNFWRILRREVTLNNYSYENCHFHILHERVPKHSFEVLTRWFGSHLYRSKVLDYYITRTEGSLRMICKLGLMPKTSTLARVYGIQFSEVFSRGSQFRVESMMLRYAKRFKYIPVSPSPRQRTGMYAPEYVPLIMEPESQFYTDPVVVLDFQSLYPSMIIAYNYCYSTCLGRISQLENDGFFQLGCSSLKIDKSELVKHRDNIHISPNGAVFLKKKARLGILPQMLKEILDTRIMVKNAMKENAASESKSNSLQRLLDARQMALKLIANVTYGYTAANFSGRMPCVEIADAIVSKGKETLERAIDLVNANFERWGGKVVYGDTDSMFILFQGCSKDEAFKRGKEIANEVTLVNPDPVKLKFEKVYCPCILQTKKRYVGFAYEDPKQEVGIFDAKGIETVRRDSCEATSKILEKSLRILFDTEDPNECKKYILRQFQKLLSGKLSIIRDFIFAKEYRGRDKYSQFARIPALEIARKWTDKDPRAEPRRGERVPYVIVYGSPDQNLYQLVRHPEELIQDTSLKLNAVYYIERVIIPPLNRVFNLINYDVFKWYEEMPRKINVARCNFFAARGKKMKNQTTISQYFVSSSCPSCGAKSSDPGLCKDCSTNCQQTAASLTYQIKDIESKFRDTALICKVCSGCSVVGDQKCSSIDCSNLFRYSQSRMNLNNLSNFHELLQRLTF